MFRRISFVKKLKAGQPGLPVPRAATYALRYRRQHRSGIERGGGFTLMLRSCLGHSLRRREQSSRRSRTLGVALFTLAHTSIPRDADWPHF